MFITRFITRYKSFSRSTPAILRLIAAESLCTLKAQLSQLVVLVVAFCMAQLAFSQAIDVSSEKDVSALLAEIESQNKTRPIYDVNSRRKIADIEFSAGYKLVKTMGGWSVIEFNKPTVPGWVSRDFVSVRGGRVSVNASRLNMRLEPSLTSNVMLQLERGFSTSLLERKNGFVRVLAPSNFQVAIATANKKGDKQTNLAVNNSVVVDKPLNKNKNTRAPRVEEKLKESDAGTISNVIDQVPASTERLHVIAPGDAISLQVFGEQDLSIGNVRVPQSGLVSLPLIGSIQAAGRTIPQIEATVAELLGQGYVNNPRLSVTIFSYRPIFLRGAVAQTGSFPFNEGLTVGKAIALAGGSKKSAKSDGVSILREGTVINEGLSVDSLVKVNSGDVISIEEEIGVQENEGSYIYLHGEVASPGEYEFRRDLTVEKAIVLAGGFTLRGSRRKISVTRYADADKGGEPEKLKKVRLFTPIKPGDIINVGATWF